MTNSNEELKVGSCVSWFNSHGWSYGKIQSEYELREFTKQVLGTYEWIFGIHTSLIPDGFELVESAEFEACKEIVELQKQQIDLLKQECDLRLELAQKEIAQLQHTLGWANMNLKDNQRVIDQLKSTTCEWTLIEEDGDYLSGCKSNDYVMRYEHCPDCGFKTVKAHPKPEVQTS